MVGSQTPPTSGTKLGEQASDEQPQEGPWAAALTALYAQLPGERARHRRLCVAPGTPLGRGWWAGPGAGAASLLCLFRAEARGCVGNLSFLISRTVNLKLPEEDKV